MAPAKAYRVFTMGRALEPPHVRYDLTNHNRALTNLQLLLFARRFQVRQRWEEHLGLIGKRREKLDRCTAAHG